MKDRIAALFKNQYSNYLEKTVKTGQKHDIEIQYHRMCAKIWAFNDIGILTIKEVEHYIELLARVKSTGVPQ